MHGEAKACIHVRDGVLQSHRFHGRRVARSAVVMLRIKKTRFLLFLALGTVAVFVFVSGASAQVLTDTSDNTLIAAISFGSLTPGTSSTPSSTQIQFRIRDNKNTGYHVTASAAFSVAAFSSAAGGSTIAASDIGIGISSIVNGNAVQTPRTDNITFGFNYNPATVTAASGLTPYTGMSSGSATLADIIATPNLTILSGPRIAGNENLNNANNAMTVTITLGVLGQFFTPATFSGTLTLTIIDGP